MAKNVRGNLEASKEELTGNGGILGGMYSKGFATCGVSDILAAAFPLENAMLLTAAPSMTVKSPRSNSRFSSPGM